MAKALAVDWNYAFTLFSQGLTLQEIATQLGASLTAVKSQSSRKGWSNMVADARATIRLAATTAATRATQAQIMTIADRAERWVDATASDIERTVATLTELKPPKNLKGLKQHEEVWGMHVKRGRATFGLDQQTQAVQVNIGLFGQGDVQEKPVDPVIDVASTLHNPEQSP